MVYLTHAQIYFCDLSPVINDSYSIINGCGQVSKRKLVSEFIFIQSIYWISIETKLAHMFSFGRLRKEPIKLSRVLWLLELWLNETCKAIGDWNLGMNHYADDVDWVGGWAVQDYWMSEQPERDWLKWTVGQARFAMFVGGLNAYRIPLHIRIGRIQPTCYLGETSLSPPYMTR